MSDKRRGRGSHSNRSQLREACCLIDENGRCRKLASNASYNKRIQNHTDSTALSLHIDPAAKHAYICEYHKTLIKSARKQKNVRRDTTKDSTKEVGVNLSQLSINTLRKYKEFYGVQTKPGANRAQLVEALTEHFNTIPVDNEHEIISTFLYNIKAAHGQFNNEPKGNGSDGRDS